MSVRQGKRQISGHFEKKEALLAMKEARFDILEEIKTVNIGNEMAVTASIGMGLDSPTYTPEL